MIPTGAPTLEKQQFLDEVVEVLKKAFGQAIGEIKRANRETSVYVSREKIVEVARFLRDHERFKFNFLSDLTGFDRGIDSSPRFEVIYHLLSLPNRVRLRLKVQVDEDDCTVPSVTEVWKTANWHERETFDLFGIRFSGHPDLRKILTPEDLEGHPLRKDFPLRGY
ncbi:MAG: NADH-quinone oxidoreductase subunit C [Acidobacteriota bacterium]|nr:NADH-quinone oxidoreductase subunit C [Blastocatellia bacterium]MDW8412768.1 NADH-quinone oxidoreductase subunit C [Acidobacteriota bacterium]